MHRLGAGLRAALFLLLIIASSFVEGQEASTHSPDQVNQAFSVVNTSLSRAVDSALIEAGSTEPAVPSIGAGQEASNHTVSKLGPKLKATNTRLDALRSVILPILKRERLPEGLLAVMFVESAGNPMALSPKGARGLWQLMPDTARRYGLRVDAVTDERIDVVKSTTAAAQYLRALYDQFGSWPLALAAYNAGEQSLQRAISRSGSNEFATLSFLHTIPEETRAYVPAVLAAMGTMPATMQTPAVPVYAWCTAKETPQPEEQTRQIAVSEMMR